MTDTEKVGLFQLWILVNAMGYIGHCIAHIPVELPEWVEDE
jgi:hypothetical protein